MNLFELLERLWPYASVQLRVECHDPILCIRLEREDGRVLNRAFALFELRSAVDPLESIMAKFQAISGQVQNVPRSGSERCADD